MEELTFDSIERKQIPVTIAGKKYVLLEADGAAGTTYQNALMSATRMDKTGSKIHIEGMANAEPLLLSRCLYYADDSGKVRMGRDGSPDPKYLVALRTIQGWPNRIQTRLFDELKKISDLSLGTKTEPDTEETLKAEIEDRENRLAILRGDSGSDPTLPTRTWDEIKKSQEEDREEREKN